MVIKFLENWGWVALYSQNRREVKWSNFFVDDPSRRNNSDIEEINRIVPLRYKPK